MDRIDNKILCEDCHASFRVFHKVESLLHTLHRNYGLICFSGANERLCHHMVVWIEPLGERESMEIVCGICEAVVPTPKEKLNETWGRLHAFLQNPRNFFQCPQHTLDWRLMEKWKEDENQC